MAGTDTRTHDVCIPRELQGGMVISQKHKLLNLLYSRAVFFPTVQLTRYPYDPFFARMSKVAVLLHTKVGVYTQ